MNSCGLRIGASDSKKVISGIAFKPVVIPDIYKYLEKHELLKYFMDSSAEEQVTSVKKLLNCVKEHHDDDVIFFLVITYLYAEIKHPVKCIITRFVTKNGFIQKFFAAVLTQQLLLLIDKPHSDYKTYMNVISKVASCTENFPVGAIAVKNLEVQLMRYLTDCLTCCTSTVSNEKLPPTSKNEVFGLAHTVLRLILYVIQKMDSENIAKLTSILEFIRSNLKHLMFDDSPMDTKSVCGILFVSMHVMENGSDTWVEILNPNNLNTTLQEFLSNDSSKLSVYSAIATVIPMRKLHSQYIEGEPAIIKLTDNILELGDRYSSEPIFILGVARTIVQISKGLDKSGDSGLYLLDRLFLFVWSNLEHNTDSIQHLSAQILTNVIKFCSHLRKKGNETAMNELFKTLSSLERTRKSFYLSLTALTDELGTECVLNVWPNIITETINLLHIQAIQASATTTLETLLRHSHTDAHGVYVRWVEPALRCVREGAACVREDAACVREDATRVREGAACVREGAACVRAVAGLLHAALGGDPALLQYILPYIRNISESSEPEDLTCVLVLASVLRQAGLAGGSGVGPSGDTLRVAAIHTGEEIRILAISLIVESPRSTEIFTEDDLEFLLWFIAYNINAQAAHFRQLVLSLMKKFFKRFQQSYKTLTRESLPNSPGNKSAYYLHFSDKLTDLCFENLLPGGNHNRRHVALQLLVWLGNIDFEGVDRRNFHLFKENNEALISERISTLIDILGDSYESNKELALQLLYRCQSDLLYSQEYASTLHLESIIEQASSMKPTECVTAGYKLKLLTRKLVRYIDANGTTQSEVSFRLLKILIEHLKRQVSICSEDIARGARIAPMYGVMHCVALALEDIDTAQWSDAHTQTCVWLVSLCKSVCECASTVLCSAAPEGHLPETHQGKIRFDDGGEVTAQMVLLCAWRSVKEVSLTLSLIVSKVTNSTDRNIKISLVKEIGNSFLQLLTETKHRGAFEQVYVGFSRMLKSLWCDSEPELNDLPKQWLSELMDTLESGDSGARLCATRRSAGLPFMIQALVVSQLQASPVSFPRVAAALLRAARSAALETRCHCMNVLRALYRSAAVGGAAGGGGGGRAGDGGVGAAGGGDGGVGAALRLAVRGCGSDAWLERNSATLLFAALMVRVFGVQRSRHRRLCERNKMTGRIFFLRYPQLYDFMLDKLQQASVVEGLHPALYPVLLLLARLYPSALEGSVSILKLECFAAPLVRCGRQPALPLRRLAARALPHLLPAGRYLSHLEEMLDLLSDRKIKRNFCHGILLQITKLLDERTDAIAMDEEINKKLATLIEGTSWILQQSLSETPCYLLTDEYIKLIHVILWKFNSLITKNFMDRIRDCLTKLLFDKNNCKINPGRELCLANAVYLYFILNIYNDDSDICPFVFKCLAHETYEVVLAVLNYLLISHHELEPENMLQEHIYENENILTLDRLKNDLKYIEALCDVLRSSKYLECTTKCLQVLTLEPNTQKHIVLTKSGGSDISDEQIMIKLFYYIENEHENFTHIYLKNLTGFLGSKLDSVSHLMILEALRIIFSCSLSNNSEETRRVAVEFLESNFEHLLSFEFQELGVADAFETRAMLWSTCVSLLEDDDTHTRTRTAHTIARTCDVSHTHTRTAHTIARTCDVTHTHTRTAHTIARTCDVTRARNARVIPSRAMELLIDYVQKYETDAVAMLAVIALINFDCEVCLTDEVTDECRVFDHNERYNTNLEEAVWSRACADAIKTIYDKSDIAEELCDVTEHSTYRQTFESLCSAHVDVYKNIVRDSKRMNDGNPKVDVFVKRLRL